MVMGSALIPTPFFNCHSSPLGDLAWWDFPCLMSCFISEQVSKGYTIEAMW